MSWFLLFLSQIASCSSPRNILTSLPAHTVLHDQQGHFLKKLFLFYLFFVKTHTEDFSAT